jgi:flagellar biosynthesis protein FlhB
MVAYSVVAANWTQLMALAWLPPLAAMAVVGEIMRTMAIRVALIWLALAAIDYFYQRKRLDKELRMTKEEVKQEMKEMEQSPELKRAIAIRRRKLSRRMMQAVKSASVIVTNPTHYSVAIVYEAGKAHAPQIVAKGSDHLAFRIREIATENDVPIVPNPPLARALYKHCEVGDFIPREYFQPVAEVLAYVYRTVKRIRTRT